MCRLYLLWKREIPTTTNRLERFLLDTAASSTSRESSDGYGLAGFSEKNHRWKIYKTMDTYLADSQKTRVLRDFAKYSFVIGHLRKTPKWSETTIYNTHPFTFQNQVFMHNGDIHGLYENREVVLQRITPELHDSIYGSTDTELFFYLYITIIRELMSAPTESNPDFETHEMQILYYAMMKTLGFLQKHFAKITGNVIYANKKYTIITRYFHSDVSDSFRSLILYWNIPKSPINKTDSSPSFISPSSISPSSIFITTNRVEGEELYVFPLHTLVCIENITGKLWSFPIHVM